MYINFDVEVLFQPIHIFEYYVYERENQCNNELCYDENVITETKLTNFLCNILKLRGH